MTKKAGGNSLQAMLNRASAGAVDPVALDAPEGEGAAVADAPVAPARKRGRPSLASQGLPPAKRASVRADTKMIGGHFPAETSQQLRMLAVEEDTTVQALLEEAIADLLTKKAGRKVRR